MSQQPNKVGWSINNWGRATDISRSTVNRLIKNKKIEAVKLEGAKVVITTDPKAYLRSQPPA